MKQKALLMVNPKSGKQAAKLGFYSIVSNLSLKYEVTVHITRSGKDIVQTARECSFPTLIVCGGDGTLSHAVEGLLQNPAREEIKLGYIPCGTANDVASTLDIPKSLAAGALYVCRNTPKKQDVGEIGGRPFVYTASFGTFTKASYETPQDAKNLLGGLAYLLNGASELLDVKGYDLTIEWDEGVLQKSDVTFCGVSNTHYLGGGLVRYPPEFAELDDGKLELLTVARPKNLFDLENIVRSIALREFNNEFVSLIQSSRFSLRARTPLAWTIDGENGGEMQKAEIVCLPGAISLIRK